MDMHIGSRLTLNFDLIIFFLFFWHWQYQWQEIKVGYKLFKLFILLVFLFLNYLIFCFLAHLLDPVLMLNQESYK